MGSLTIVGTGIMFPSQMTFAAAETIKDADIVFYNVGIHPLAVQWIIDHSKKSVDLYSFYGDGKDRQQSYDQMTNAMVDAVKEGQKAVGVFYGHPGVFVGPAYDAIIACRKHGKQAVMLPGVSAFDCMIADLEFDPAVSGCVMIEATEYILFQKKVDPYFPLVLWQAGVVGDFTFALKQQSDHVDILKQRLLEDYPEDHTIIAYVAATLPGMKPSVDVGTIGKLEQLSLNASSTCLIPPIGMANLHKENLELLRSRTQKQ